MRFDEDYENYEPDIAIWPYVLLTILLPLIPFVGNMFLFPDDSNMSLFWNIIGYVIAALPLLASAIITRTAEGRGVLLVNAAIYIFAVIGKWAEQSVMGTEGFALGIPIVTAFAPALLPVMAYIFYSKRKRKLGWGLFLLIAFLSEAFFIFYLYWSTGKLEVIYSAYAVLILLLAFMMLFVSRRSEGAPWYINIVLIILVFLTLIVTEKAPEMLALLSSKGSMGIRPFLFYILETIATNYLLWFTISCSLSFAALGMKSCYAELDVSSVLSEEGDDAIFPERESPAPAAPLFREEPIRQENQDRGYDMDEPIGKYYHGMKEVNRELRREEPRRYPEEEYRRESSRPYYEEPRRYQERDYYDDRRRSDDRHYPEDYSRAPRRDEYPPRREDDRRRPYYPDEDSYRYDDRRSRHDDRRYVEDDYYAPRQKRDPYRERRYGDEFRNSEERDKDKWYQLLKGEIPEDEFRSRR